SSRIRSSPSRMSLIESLRRRVLRTEPSMPADGLERQPRFETNKEWSACLKRSPRRWVDLRSPEPRRKLERLSVRRLWTGSDVPRWILSTGRGSVCLPRSVERWVGSPSLKSSIRGVSPRRGLTCLENCIYVYRYGQVVQQRQGLRLHPARGRLQGRVRAHLGY